MDESAAYYSHPNLSPKFQTRKNASWLKPGGSNDSANIALPPPQHDPQPAMSTSNGLGAEDPLSDSGFRRGLSPLSVRNPVMSDSEQSEIISPIPRKHSSITTQESLPWLRTETPSPAPSNWSLMSGYSAANPAATNRTRRSLTSPSIRLHDQPSSITRGSRKPSSIGFLAEGSRGGVGSGRMGHSTALMRLVADPHVKERVGWEGGFARRWIKWMHKGGIKQWILPCVLLTTTWVKWATGLGSYSGQDTPPMFGDYEAQRHWMEITTHLPFQQWYKYDLQYWGLDYPPLTAYISWLCGIIGSWIEPSWFALDASRGIETDGSKVFMRATVLVCDLLYVWAVIMFTRTIQATRSTRTQNFTIIILLMQPALLLVDFGHFQYNSVMLAFTLLCINHMSKGQDLIAAVFFVASLGFKQMSLYYAPAIGPYLLAKCIYLGQKNGGKLFVHLSIVTVASFLLLFLPFLPPFASPTAILDPITRIFPFSRGLFEDKVANFWCFSNVVLKWRNFAGSGALVKLSTLLTAVGFSPAVVGLLRTGFSLRIKDDPTDPSTISGVFVEGPRVTPPAKVEEQKGQQENELSATEPGPLFSLLLFSMLTSSLSFFLFSFQVHEKTILVPLLPLTLIMTGASGSVESTTWELGMLTNNVAVFSMWPLLKRDGLGIQYAVLTVLWNATLGYTPFKHPRSFSQFVSLAVSVACVALHSLELVIHPPVQYPDLFPVLNVLVSTPVFGLIWLWSIKSGVEVGWAIAGLGGNPGTTQAGGSLRLTSSSSGANLTSTTSAGKSHSHAVHRGDSGSPFPSREPPYSPLSAFNRRIGSPPVIPGPQRHRVRGRTWSSASANSNTRTRGNIPLGPEWDRPFKSDHAERVEDGNASIQELGLNFGGQGESPSDRRRSRVQSLGVSNVRKRAPHSSGTLDGFPPPSD